MTSPATAAPADDAAALKARIAALEAENERLASLAETTPIEPLVSAEPTRRKRNGWRAFVSALCIVIASILVPVSIVAAWARVELVDPDQFVATFGPLVDDPEVQAVVIDQVTGDGGSVKIGGEIWTARAYDEDAVLEPGARVDVMQIQGATALVAE